MVSGSELLRGLVVPLVTGLNEQGLPDAAGSDRFLDAMAHAGVTKIMVLGSNGEGPLIPTSSLKPYLSEIVQAWRDRIADGVVIINATAPGTAEALERGALAVEAGADAVAVCAPFYFRHRDDEILEHFRSFADLGAPIVAYNIPRYVNELTPAVIEQLPELAHVVGVKDSSGDPGTLARFVALKQTCPDFGVSQGGEAALLAGLQLGVDGIVPGTANIAPRVALDLIEAWRAGDMVVAEHAQEVVTSLTGIHRVRAGVPTVKTILDLLGLLSPSVAAPLIACTPAERSELEKFIDPFRSDLISGRPDLSASSE